MLVLLKKLIKIGLLTPRGLFYLAVAVYRDGVNLMTLLAYAARRHEGKAAVADEAETISFRALYEQSLHLAEIFAARCDLRKGKRAALVCRSHVSLLRALFAAARCGADVYLVNPEMSRAQIGALHERLRFDFLIYEQDLFAVAEENKFDSTNSFASDQIWEIAFKALSEKSEKRNSPRLLPRVFSGEIVVLTGGTTGAPKTARRKPSIFNFLNPFFALLTELELDRYRSVYVATPLNHGFGIAAVFVSFVLGSETFVRPRFSAAEACALVKEKHIEVVTVVPLMLRRMLDEDAAALVSLGCVITGGAAISPTLVTGTLERLGDVLFNLYGTSEAGVCIIAAPRDLRRTPDTIGRAIRGVGLRILDDESRPLAAGKIGRLCIQSSWTAKKSGGAWTETGDLGFTDDDGLIYLRGRVDEMIVSGGENVYPVELENALLKHPSVRQAAVVGMPDLEFGQRLKAFVVCDKENAPTAAELSGWLAARIARFQMPAAIELRDDLPVTPIGKIDKKVLK